MWFAAQLQGRGGVVHSMDSAREGLLAQLIFIILTTPSLFLVVAGALEEEAPETAGVLVTSVTVVPNFQVWRVKPTGTAASSGGPDDGQMQAVVNGRQLEDL